MADHFLEMPGLGQYNGFKNHSCEISEKERESERERERKIETKIERVMENLNCKVFMFNVGNISFTLVLSKK